MVKKNIIVMAVVILAFIVLVFSFNNSSQEKVSTPKGQKQIALINFNGPIMGGHSIDSVFSGVMTGSMTAMEQLREAAADPDVAVVLLRMNTPGGSVSASQEIAMEILRVKESGKPIVVSMGDMAASAGYYLAAFGDKIIANPATITGSLGVIMQVANLEELYEKIGIEYNYIKSGEYKDMGAPDRKLFPEEEKMLQEIVDEMYNDFINTIAQVRDIPIDELMQIADGRILTGNQALELGLIDGLGNYYDAIDLAAELGGIVGEPVIKTYRKGSIMEIILGGENPLNLQKFFELPGESIKAW